ncbi:MAG: hypothetical protein NC319_02715 [Butyricicoccus sp.]|nr:hypothetical protein [Butyricicoccus sp.]
MVIREYKPSDCATPVRSFRDTVRPVNAKECTKEQLNAWAPESADPEKWNRSLSTHYTLVALEGLVSLTVS